MEDQFNDTHVLRGERKYSISVLLNKEYLDTITKGMSDEERYQKYKEYEDWCLKTTLFGA